MALKNWIPRLAVAHIDVQDLMDNIRPNCETWRQFHEAFNQRGDMHKKLGDEAVKAGNKITAGQAYALAAAYYHFSKYCMYTEHDLYEIGNRKTIETYRLAAPLLDPPAERLEIEVDGFKVYGYLRKPKDGKNSGVVLNLPGADSVKEEFCSLEEYFLDRGMATLSLDGPGQGETYANCLLNTEAYKKAIKKVLDYLDSRKDLTHHYGTCGISMGATFSFLCASVDPRFTAIAGSCGPCEVMDVEKMNPILRLAFKHLFDAQENADLQKHMATLDATGVAKTIKCPSLYIQGGRDTVIPTEYTQGYKKVPKCEYAFFPEGNHVCNNIPYIYRPLIADFLKSKFEA